MPRLVMLKFLSRNRKFFRVSTTWTEIHWLTGGDSAVSRRMGNKTSELTRKVFQNVSRGRLPDCRPDIEITGEVLQYQE